MQVCWYNKTNLKALFSFYTCVCVLDILYVYMVKGDTRLGASVNSWLLLWYCKLVVDYVSS